METFVMQLVLFHFESQLSGTRSKKNKVLPGDTLFRLPQENEL